MAYKCEKNYNTEKSKMISLAYHTLSCQYPIFYLLPGIICSGLLTSTRAPVTAMLILTCLLLMPHVSSDFPFLLLRSYQECVTVHFTPVTDSSQVCYHLLPLISPPSFHAVHSNYFLAINLIWDDHAPGNVPHGKLTHREISDVASYDYIFIIHLSREWLTSR